MNKLLLLFATTPLILATACARKNVDVTISSDAFSSAAAGSAAVAAGADVSALRFCVTRIKLSEGDDDSTGSSELAFEIGEVTLDGPAREWSTVSVPAGFRADRIQIKVHQDQNLCPGLAHHSIEIDADGTTRSTQQDVEFKWRFPQPVTLDQGTLVLSMNEVIAALKTGDLNSLKETIEGVEGSCKKM